MGTSVVDVGRSRTLSAGREKDAVVARCSRTPLGTHRGRDVVHGSEVTLLITWIGAFVVTIRANVSPITVVNSPAVRTTSFSSSAAHYAPTLKNSRSTRRERRIQQSTGLVV